MGIRNTLFKILGLMQYLAIYAFLQCKGYKTVRPFLFKSWHHGVSYFTVLRKYDNLQFFIKTSGTYNAAKTEYFCLNSINSFQEQLVPKAIALYDWYIFSFVVMEKIEGSPLAAANIKQSEFFAFCQDIIKALNHTKIVHRDISPDNIMVDSQGKAFLIDFAWAATPENNSNEKKHIENLKALGGKFKLGELKWQDSFSLQLIYKHVFKKEIYFKNKTVLFDIQSNKTDDEL